MADTFTRDRFAWLDSVLADHELQQVTFKVAYVIACHVNRQSGEAWPSIDTIAEIIGVDGRTVARSISQLCEGGHLEKRRGGFGKSNRYVMVERAEAPISIPDTHVTNGVSIPDSHVTTENAIHDSGVTSFMTPLSPHSRHPCHPNPLTEPFENEPSDLEIYQPASGASKETPRQEDHSEAFEDFWKVYPRHVAKGTAKRAFEKALKIASTAVIIAGARRYAAERAGQDPKFTKHAATWLNAECWTDENPAVGGGAIIDPSGTIIGQAVEASRFQPRTPGQQREDDINAMMNMALRRMTT